MCKNFKSASGQSRARLAPTHPRTPPVLGVKRTQTCRSLPGNRENRENLLKERWRGRGAATERRRQKGRGGGGDRWDRGRSGDEGEGGRVSETVGDRSVSRLGEEGGSCKTTETPADEFFRCGGCSRYWAASEGFDRSKVLMKWSSRKESGKIKTWRFCLSTWGTWKSKLWMKKRMERKERATLWSDEVVCVTD